jgi:hypothetical protein
VLLSVLSCSKKKDPEPVFEGTWDAISSVSTTYINEQQKNQSTTTFPGRNGPNGNYMTVTSTTIQSYYNYGGSTGPITHYTRSGNVLFASIIPSGSTTPVLIPSATITQLTATGLTIETKSTAVQPTLYDYFIVEAHYQRR